MLAPEAGLINIQIQGPNDITKTFIPLSIHEPADPDPVQLEPGENLPPQDIKLFFGAQGWTFNKPGHYRLRATYPINDNRSAPRLVAELELDVAQAEPATAEDIQALIRDPEVGRFLLYDGAAHLPEARSRVLGFIARNSITPQANSLRASLLLDALNPPIDPGTGRQLPARRLEAQSILATLQESQAIGDIRLTTLARARLLEAYLLAELGRMSAARRVLSETADVVQQQVSDTNAEELVFGEQKVRNALQEVLRTVPRSRETLEAKGIDVDAVLSSGDGNNF
jgi:hypothetical protein